jgi:membrane protease YdiL (CAAX protease family)
MNSSILNNGMSTSKLLRLGGDRPLESEAPQAAPTAAAPPVVRPAPGLGESLLWAVGLFVVAQLIPVVVLNTWSHISGGGRAMFHEYTLHALLGGQLLGVCLSVFALRVRVGRDWMSAIHLRLPALVPCLLAVLCLPAVKLGGGAACVLAEHVLGVSEPSRQLMADSSAQHALWFSLLVIAVGAAVNEELFCRGFLGRGLVGRHGVLLGVLFTSVIFAILHGNIPQGIFAFVLGVYVHLAYLATRSLWVPILLHFLNNAIGVVLVYFLSQVAGDLGQAASPDVEQTGNVFELLVGIAIVLVITVQFLTFSILSAWGLYRLRDRQIAAEQVV